jgi:hypothetical protein
MGCVVDIARAKKTVVYVNSHQLHPICVKRASESCEPLRFKCYRLREYSNISPWQRSFEGRILHVKVESRERQHFNLQSNQHDSTQHELQ